MQVTWTTLAVLAVLGQTTLVASQGRACGEGQACVPIASCPEIQALLARPTRLNVRRIQEAICVRRRGNTQVCCSTSDSTPQTPPTRPTDPTPTPRPGNGGGGRLPSNCGIGNLDKVFHGEDAAVGAYPWTAAIGYTQAPGGPVTYRCGGALINERYVVTAAHCIHDTYTKGLTPVSVRLGEHDFASPGEDCSTRTPFCIPPPQDFSFEETPLLHPQFNRRVPESDDIALIRLDRNAVYNAGVQPICLPAAGQDVEAFLAGRDVVAAGWGTTQSSQNSSVLQVVPLPFVPLQECRAIHPDIDLVEQQLCFGGRGRQDSCSGDSGGPVILDAAPRTLVGIVSKGKACGTPGFPAIYTNVASYRTWIEQNIRA